MNSRLRVLISGILCFNLAVLAQSVPQSKVSATGVQAADKGPSVVPQPSLGVVFQNATTSDQTKVMLVIETVVDRGPADKAGMKRGDTILSLDGHPVANLSELQRVISALAVGSTIKAGYLHDGQHLETEVTLVERTKLYVDWYEARAERGDSASELALGSLYLRGEGKPKDFVLAFQWVSKAAEAGSIPAQVLLGGLYAEGIGVAKDEPKAVQIWLQAAQQGSGDAQDALGKAYKTGRGVAVDDKQAFLWYSKAAKGGHAGAETHLASMYYIGAVGVPQDFAQAAAWYKKAAGQGYAAAEFSLGGMYEAGQAVPKDMTEAVNLYTEAADQGYTLAEVYLANMYAVGYGTHKDLGLALKYYRSASAHGSAEAQNNLAFLLESGEGVTQDCKAAFDLYSKSASHGWGAANSNLGSLYFWGICGAPRDMKAAFEHFSSAAEKGELIAEVMIAQLYADGLGTPVDHGQAATWYRKAAERGVAVAQNNLGYLLNGNFDNAKRWFEKAAESGDRVAKYNLRYLTESISDDPPLKMCKPLGQSLFCEEELIGWQHMRAAFNRPVAVPSVVMMDATGNCGMAANVVPPAYPPLAVKLQLAGDAAANVTVKDGAVSSVTVSNGKNNEGPDPLFAKAVEDAVRPWSFPACSASKSYGTRVTFTFSLSEAHPIDRQAVDSAESCYQSAGISEVKQPTNASWCEEGFKQALAEMRGGEAAGDAKSMAREAFMLEYGQGTDKDSSAAFRLYSQAAEHGSPDAAFRVGRYYEDGKQVPLDRGKAFKFYLQSAKGGIAAGEYRVAVMFENGIGTPKNTAEAIRWYQVAKRQGVEEASAAVARLVPDKDAPPDGAARAAARRAYAGTLENRMRQSLLANNDVDPTLVRLRVTTTTPQSNDGNTREDYRLTLESNAYTLPRDVTKLLRNYSLNGQLYALGFRELSIQDSVGAQMGTILCEVQLSAKGARPLYCMHMEIVNYVGGTYGEGSRRPGWNEYYIWPADYVVGSTP